MIINKYKAKTEKEALEQAKKDLGEAAIVLNVKKIKPRGFMKIFKKKVVEITAAIDDNVYEEKSDNHIDLEIKPDKEKDKGYLFGESLNKNSDSYSEESQNAIEERINNIARLLEEQMNLSKKDNLAAGSSNNNVVVNETKKETILEADKKSSSAVIEKTETKEKTESDNKVLKLIHDKLVESEVKDDYVEAIVGDLVIDNKSPLDNVLASIYQKIVLKLGKVEPLEYTEKKPKVVFFVGNTGVGKTTTMAKLASKCMLEDKKRIAMISVDTYRIAAIEQIKTYANILGAPMEVVYTPEDMVNSVEKYKDFDVILVDTAGRSHKNEDQKNDLKNIVDSVKDYETEVYLVVSATVKYSDLLNIAKTYSDLFDYKLIFTKLDETSGVGCILNLKLDMNKALSYVTWGQNVPDDMGVLNPQIIAKKLLGGGV